MPLTLLAVAGFSFCLDQATKMLVSRRLAAGQSVPVTSWLSIKRLDNARGLPLLRNSRGQLLLLAAVAGGVCLIVWQGLFFQRPAAQVGLGLALGGAIGNVYDQFRRGAVLDFLDLGWWPVFNLADAAITMGVLTALWFFH
jgi:signal peptidase II